MAFAELGVGYRHTRPDTPQTNGMVARSNGRIESEVLGITIHSHRNLEQLLRGINAAYNARRQRVLHGRTPDQAVAERLTVRRKFHSTKPAGQVGPQDIAKAHIIIEDAKVVSQPDTIVVLPRCSRIDAGRSLRCLFRHACMA